MEIIGFGYTALTSIKLENIIYLVCEKVFIMTSGQIKQFPDEDKFVYWPEIRNSGNENNVHIFVKDKIVSYDTRHDNRREEVTVSKIGGCK